MMKEMTLRMGLMMCLAWCTVSAALMGASLPLTGYYLWYRKRRKSGKSSTFATV